MGCNGAASDIVPGSTAKACTLMGCESGVRVDFTYREQGTYVIDVTVDGKKTTCTATLPIAKGSVDDTCSDPDVLLMISGSMLSADQQSIGGLMLNTTTAKNISIHATRDGAVIGDKSFAPPYVTRPGPNGPGCEPDSCTLATSTFP